MVTTAVAMAMEDTGEAITGMADTVDTTARGLLMLSPRLRLMPSPLLPLSPATATTVTATDTDTVTVTPAPTPTDTTATTARGPLMPSPAMATTAEDTAMEVTATAMAVDTMARGPPMPSPDMVTTAEGTDTDMATDMATATTDEMFRSSCCSIRESSAKINLDLIGY